MEVAKLQSGKSSKFGVYSWAHKMGAFIMAAPLGQGGVKEGNCCSMAAGALTTTCWILTLIFTERLTTRWTYAASLQETASLDISTKELTCQSLHHKPPSKSPKDRASRLLEEDHSQPNCTYAHHRVTRVSTNLPVNLLSTNIHCLSHLVHIQPLPPLCGLKDFVEAMLPLLKYMAPALNSVYLYLHVQDLATFLE